MKDLWAVLKREFTEATRKKSFLIWTIITPFYMALLFALPSWLASKKSGPDRPKQIAIIDRTGILRDRLIAALVDTLPNGRKMFQVETLDPQLSPDSTEALCRARVLEGTLDAYVNIPAEALDSGRAQFYSKSTGDFILPNAIERRLNQALLQYRSRTFGIDSTVAAALTRRADLAALKVTKEGAKTTQFITGYLVALSFVMILMSLILSFGQTLMRGIIEEKNSRVIEVLVSSVRPFQLLMGKVLGLGVAGLFQIVIWVAMAVLAFALTGSQGWLGQALTSIPGNLVTLFIIYFILGYFLYSAFFALIGAVCQSEQEAQHLMFPLILFLIMPFILGFMVSQNPGGSVSTLLSFFPLLTPTLMVMRSYYLMPPVTQIAASIVVLLVSIVLVGWFSAKVFRVGILMYGKRPTLPEVLRWVRYR